MNELQTKDPEKMTLLILEHGAPWPTWINGHRSRANHAAVEVQAQGESAEEFAQRLVARIERIKQQNLTVLGAGYVCAPSGAERTALRRKSCEALLSVFSKNEQPELILAAGDWDASDPERDVLIQLWSELSQLVPNTSVSIRFEETEDKSGVFRSVMMPHPGRVHPARVREATHAQHTSNRKRWAGVKN